MQTPISSGTATASQIDLSVVVSTQSSVGQLLYDQIIEGSSAWTGDLKTGISACAAGTEAYWAGSTRVPTGGANYWAKVVLDQSCRPCDDNKFASKTGERPEHAPDARHSCSRVRLAS